MAGPMAGRLRIQHRDPGSQARAGILRTPHGEVRTPAFVPLASKATVKGLLPAEVAALGYDMVLGNTFHLFLDPGHDLIARFGGLHDVMGWLQLPYNHPNFGRDFDVAETKLGVDAVKAADPYVDYASFDSDKDGQLSVSELHITVIVAGYET